jgi:hypothetical protein
MTWETLGQALVLQQYRPGSLEQRLLSAPVVADALVQNQTANAGSSTVLHVILSDSGGPFEAYHKPLDGVDRQQAGRYGHDPFSVLLNESAAWFLARVLGDPYRRMVPDMVVRSIWSTTTGAIGGFGALSIGVPGDANRQEPLNDAGFCDPAAFFDALIGQQDRHMNNFRWDPGRLSLLDNGYAFGAPTPQYLRWASAFVVTRHGAARSQLAPDEITVLQRLQSEAAIRAWLHRLLRQDQADAFSDRVDRMLASGQLLQPLEF